VHESAQIRHPDATEELSPNLSGRDRLGAEISYALDEAIQR